MPLCLFNPGSHLVWLPGGHQGQTQGVLATCRSSLKCPHEPVSPHPLLAWGPGATPQSCCQSSGAWTTSVAPGVGSGGVSDLGPTCSPLSSFALSAQELSQPWEHPALGCQLVLLQDPVLGSVTCWRSPPGPGVQDKRVFRAGLSLSLSMSGLSCSHPPWGPRARWGVGTVGHRGFHQRRDVPARRTCSSP